MGFVDCVGTLFVIMGPVKEIRKSEGPQRRESSKVASPHGVLHTPPKKWQEPKLIKKRHIVYINHKFIFERQKKACYYVHKTMKFMGKLINLDSCSLCQRNKKMIMMGFVDNCDCCCCLLVSGTDHLGLSSVNMHSHKATLIPKFSSEGLQVLGFTSCSLFSSPKSGSKFVTIK